MISIKQILHSKEDRDLIRSVIQEFGGSLYKVTDLLSGQIIYHA